MKAQRSIYIAIILLVSACGINQKEIKPEDSFRKIYNHPDEKLSFFPESVVELDQGGYLFISSIKDEQSEIEYPYTHVVRTNATGEVVWTQDYDWLAPASNLIRAGTSVGFVAMDPQLNAFALLLDPSSGEITSSHDLEMTAPLFAYNDASGDLVVLGFDFISRSSWISRFNSNLDLQRSSKLPANKDLQLPIQRHLNKTGEQYPFFIGEFRNEGGDGYYVSCFYEYNLVTAFVDRSSLNLTGEVFSFQTVEAISSVIHKSGNLFGLTGYYEGNNYIVPMSELDVNSIQNVKDLESQQLYELTFQAPVVTTTLSSDGLSYSLFASQTNDNATVVYQYASETDSLLGSHYTYFDQRVEVSDLIATSDGGTAVLAGIHILGKYKRPVLIKEARKRYFPEED
jgi:hypothetical protein